MEARRASDGLHPTDLVSLSPEGQRVCVARAPGDVLDVPGRGGCSWAGLGYLCGPAGPLAAKACAGEGRGPQGRDISGALRKKKDCRHVARKCCETG